MEIWKLLAVIITMSVLACSAHGMSFTLNKEHWLSKNWEDKPLVDTLAGEVASQIKRTKADQFYALMGKRADIPQSRTLGKKRNKGDMFVGLMGRRSLRGGNAEWTPHDFKKPRITAGSMQNTFTRIIPAETSTATESDKRSDLQEEWDKLQYY